MIEARDRVMLITVARCVSADPELRARHKPGRSGAERPAALPRLRAPWRRAAHHRGGQLDRPGDYGELSRLGEPGERRAAQRSSANTDCVACPSELRGGQLAPRHVYSQPSRPVLQRHLVWRKGVHQLSVGPALHMLPVYLAFYFLALGGVLRFVMLISACGRLYSGCWWGITIGTLETTETFATFSDDWGHRSCSI